MSLPSVLRALVLSVALAGVPVVAAAPAQAVSTGLVITEVYGAGGNSGAAYNADFVELRNLGTTAATLDGLAIHYRSATGSGSTPPFALTGSVPAGGRYLIRMSTAGSTGAALPAPNAVASPAFAMSATDGQVLLTVGTAPFTGSGDVAGDPALVDMVGYGDGATTFERAATGVDTSATLSAQRFDSDADTDHNAADFSEQPPTPGAAFDPPRRTIAEIQGTGAASPLVGQQVRTRGVVTARYPRGGFSGIYVQTGGAPATDGASDGVFVYAPNLLPAAYPAVGTSVEVVGTVSEFGGLTELTIPGPPSALTSDLPAVVPLSVPWTELDTSAEREPHEGELVAPQGPFTVTDSYDTDNFGEIGLAAGSSPLRAPTDVHDAQGTEDDALAADNARRLVTLDDGASVNFRDAANSDTPYSWLTPDNHVRAGAPVTFHQPLVLDYRNNAWKLQPDHRIVGAGREVATFADTRTAAPAPVGGDIRMATFNVLNFFPTTGEEYVAAGLGTCTYFVDRDGQRTTVNRCDPNGPRGAANETNLARQRSKIVTAINRLDASIVSLEEIENSIWFDKPRDFAVGRLVEALNAAAGAGTWAFVPSPPASELPPQAEQDVIRTAFIYKPGDVALVGESRVLTGSAAFADAREPLAQAFKRLGAPDSAAFSVIVNHFKSKGSGTPDPYGQGNANDQRIAQAQALDAFADQFAAARGTAAVFLTGDFNSYSEEDPIQLLKGAGYTKLESTTSPGETSYYFDGLAGSLDHVLANPAALEMVTGVDIWNINAEEPVAFEYSRYNGNATMLYDGSSPHRASDHNPEVVGLRAPAPVDSTVTATVSPDRVKAKKTRPVISVRVTADGVTPTGTVTVSVAGQPDRTVTLVDGAASVQLDAFRKAGDYPVTITYSGDEWANPASTTVTVQVRN